MLTRTRKPTPQSHNGAGPVVVVGYDGFEESRGAVAVAAQRAGPEGILAVVYVIEPVPDWLGSTYRQRAPDKRHLAAQVSLNQLSADLGGVRVETDVVEGEAAEALIRVAQVRQAEQAEAAGGAEDVCARPPASR